MRLPNHKQLPFRVTLTAVTLFKELKSQILRNHYRQRSVQSYQKVLSNFTTSSNLFQKLCHQNYSSGNMP